MTVFLHRTAPPGFPGLPAFSRPPTGRKFPQPAGFSEESGYDRYKEKNHVCISAKTGLGKESLLEKIEEVLSRAKRPTSFLFPHEEGGRLSLLYKSANVNEVRYETEGIYVEAVCDEKVRGALAKFIKKS